MFNITGILKVKMSEQQVNDKFRKRDFVLSENSSQYPQLITFQLVQDRCSLIDNVNVGDEIKVHFILKGREWTSPQNEVKYFNTIEAWKIESVKSENVTGGTSNPPAIAEALSASEPDDLPF